jgi:hypothetical protein
MNVEIDQHNQSTRAGFNDGASQVAYNNLQIRFAFAANLILRITVRHLEIIAQWRQPDSGHAERLHR